MDITKVGQVGLKLDTWLHSLNDKFNPTYSTWSYGRGLEQASGMGYWFIALTMWLGKTYGFDSETIHVHNFLWAWMAFVLGFAQLYYTGLTQRRIFNLMATAGWVTIAISAFQVADGWNLVTAISLPYCLCSFYVYGFLVGEK